MKIPSSNLGRTFCVSTEIVFDTQNNFCAHHVLTMFFAKRRASGKDLPVNFGKVFIFGVSASSISAGNETERKPLSGWSSI